MAGSSGNKEAGAEAEAEAAQMGDWVEVEMVVGYWVEVELVVGERVEVERGVAEARRMRPCSCLQAQ